MKQFLVLFLSIFLDIPVSAQRFGKVVGNTNELMAQPVPDIHSITFMKGFASSNENLLLPFQYIRNSITTPNGQTVFQPTFGSGIGRYHLLSQSLLTPTNLTVIVTNVTVIASSNVTFITTNLTFISTNTTNFGITFIDASTTNFVLISNVLLANPTNLNAQADTVADLANLPITVPFASLGGYHARGDGGGGDFVLTNSITSTNLGTRIASATSGYSWDRVYSGPLNIMWFGAYLNATNDSHRAITNALDIVGRGNQGKITFPIGALTVWSEIQIPLLGGVTLEGESPGVVYPNNGCVIKLNSTVSNSSLFNVSPTSRMVAFRNLKLLDGNCNESSPAVGQLAGNYGIRAHGISAADGGPGQIKHTIVEDCEIVGFWRGLGIYDDNEELGVPGIGDLQDDAWSIRRNSFTYCATGIYSNTRNFDYSTIEGNSFSTWTNGIYLKRSGFVRMVSNAGGGIGAAPEEFIRLGLTHTIHIEQCQSENYPRSLSRDYGNPPTYALPLTLLNNSFTYPYLGHTYAVTSLGNLYFGNVQASHDMRIFSQGDRFSPMSDALNLTNISYVSSSRMRLTFADPIQNTNSFISTNLTLYLLLNTYPADTAFINPYLEGRYPILDFNLAARTVDIFAYAITSAGWDSVAPSNHCTVFIKGDWQFGYDFTIGNDEKNGFGSYVVQRDSERYLNRYKESTPLEGKLSYIRSTGSPEPLFKKFAHPAGLYEVTVYGQCLTNDTITVTLSYRTSASTVKTHNFYSATPVLTGTELLATSILVNVAIENIGSAPSMVLNAMSANSLHTVIGCSFKFVGEINKTRD